MPQDAHATGSADPAEVYDVIVAGAGFSGLFLLHRLRSAGFKVLVIESGGGVGGTWYWNRYPGARCDVESVDYSFSFDEGLQQEWVWTERYAGQAEIRRYLDHVADRFDLRRDIRLNTRVDSAHFRSDTADWLVHTSDGATLISRFCIMATGPLSSIKPPDFEGLADFAGQWYHSARWPQEGVDFTGKRVAVIGTGSTGVQIIPTVAKLAEHVTVLQRTPNYSIPARNRPMSKEELDEVKATYADRRVRARMAASGVPNPPVLEPGEGVPEDEKRAHFERGWAIGGVVGILRAYSDIITSTEVNESLARFVRDKIADTVHDPVTAEKLTPRDYPLGAKRLCVDSNYFETYNRPNVTLIDVNADPIVRITPRGIQTATGHIDVDIIVFAIGFDAITGAVKEIDIRGREGLTIQDHWREGPKAHLGLAVNGFPNMFLMTGPGSPAVLGNVVTFLEQQVEMIATILEMVRSDGARTIEAEQEAENTWAAHVQEIASQTLFMKGKSWFIGANIEGKPVGFLPYAGGLVRYHAECEAMVEAGLRGFSLTK